MSDKKKSKLDVLLKKSKMDAFNVKAEYSRIQKIFLERSENINKIDIEIEKLKSELSEYVKQHEIASKFSGLGQEVEKFEKRKGGLLTKISLLDEKKANLIEEFKLAEHRYNIERDKLLASHTKSSLIDDKVQIQKLYEKEKNIQQEELMLNDAASSVKSKNK